MLERAFMGLLWIGTIICTIGAGILWFAAIRADAAPAQAAAAACACGLAIIPYVFTRAFEGLIKPAPKP